MKTLRHAVICDSIIVDDSTLDLYGNWPVAIHKDGYVWLRSTKYRAVYLHRVLTNAPAGLDVDHIDRNPRNNKLENLRIVTRQQNIINKADHPMKGVHYRKDRNKFAAAIKIDGIKTHLGNFDTAEEARAAYLSARKLADELLGYSK